MRKLKLFIASSLDGFIAREDDSIDWLFTGDYGYKKFYESIDAVLMGRKTYELTLKFNERHKGKMVYVFTKQKNLKRLGDAEFISEPVSFTKRLKQAKGKGIWLVGGGEIVGLFLSSSLIDEIILYVHPIILGKGIPLFKNVKDDIMLKLVEQFAYKDGLVKLHYKVIK